MLEGDQNYEIKMKHVKRDWKVRTGIADFKINK